MALSSPEETEEERRLLYVALTRARDALVVTYSLRYYFKRPDPMDDMHAYSQPSRFLEPATGAYDAISVGELATADDPVTKQLANLWS
jgi:superfamily I DNA/RNA helicase